MKLLLAIVRDDCANAVVGGLNEQGFSVTRISSTGGFWRRGNVTLLVGVEDDKSDAALQVLNTHAGPCLTPEQVQGPHPPHRATVFVLAVDAFDRY